jgi:hypothetical protein
MNLRRVIKATDESFDSLKQRCKIYAVESEMLNGELSEQLQECFSLATASTNKLKTSCNQQSNSYSVTVTILYDSDKSHS